MSVLSTVQLRPARAADVDFLYRLHNAAMQNYVAQTWGWDEAWQQQHFYQHFEPSVCQIIVAEGHDVGVLSVVRQAEVVYLRNIALLPPTKGVGSAHTSSQHCSTRPIAVASASSCRC